MVCYRLDTTTTIVVMHLQEEANMSLELFDVTGDAAVVTGAGRSIGEGIAKVLAGQVIVVDGGL
jgi:NADP-dependent 3-hydroxy acid dehydrogenase YdfG